MKSVSAQLSEQLERVRSRLKAAGVKRTPQRLEIFHALARSVEHPDAETVYRTVRRRLPMISLDTVYRTLWLLRELGLIETLGAHRGRARFDANLRHHHHFVCDSCGLTRDFYCGKFDGLKVPAAVTALGRPDRIQVEVRGRCLRCSKRRRG